MKTTLKLAVIGALMVMSAAQTKAALTPRTIWVQPLSYTLTAWEDGSTRPVRIGTKDIIQKLNGLTPGGGSNALNFSKSAQLLIKVDTTSSNSTQTVVVRDGKPKVDTDVSQFFSFNELATINGAHVTTSSVSTTNTFRATRHNLSEFDFEGDGLSFDLAGATTETRRDLISGGANVTQTASADVLGSGTVSTSNAVIEGKIMLGGGHLEAP